MGIGSVVLVAYPANILRRSKKCRKPLAWEGLSAGDPSWAEGSWAVSVQVKSLRSALSCLCSGLFPVPPERAG